MCWLGLVHHPGSSSLLHVWSTTLHHFAMCWCPLTKSRALYPETHCLALGNTRHRTSLDVPPVPEEQQMEVLCQRCSPSAPSRPGAFCLPKVTVGQSGGMGLAKASHRPWELCPWSFLSLQRLLVMQNSHLMTSHTLLESCLCQLNSRLLRNP